MSDEWGFFQKAKAQIVFHISLKKLREIQFLRAKTLFHAKVSRSETLA
jgi:hypothetical protein